MDETGYQFYRRRLSRGETLLMLQQAAMEGLERPDRAAQLAVKKARVKQELHWLARRKDDFLRRLLIFWDGVEYARCTDSPTGPGLGSLPGSCLAYALGLTGPDPVREGLQLPLRDKVPPLALELSPDIIEDVRAYLEDIYGPPARSVRLVPNPCLGRFRQVLTGDSPNDRVWTLPEGETDGARYALETMDRADPVTFAFLSQGGPVHLFQTPAAQALLRAQKPGSIGALAAVLARCEGLSPHGDRSHLAARALLVYQDAYLRAHYPPEYERARRCYPLREDKKIRRS